MSQSHTHQCQSPQHQDKQPGVESQMYPEPEYIASYYKGSNKLAGKTALITGGDSGIGRAVACAFAMEGAQKIIIQYLNEHEDAYKTQKLVEDLGAHCLLIPHHLNDYSACEQIVTKSLKYADNINILVNNAAQQVPQNNIEDINLADFENTFKVNIFAYFYMVKALVSFLKKGSSIINTASVTAYKGSAHLLDYSATKGAIVSFTRSLSQNLIEKEIRVNAVAPGPIWTPLIPATFSATEVANFGQNVPMKRAGQPSEVAPSYVFLASKDSSYMTGQVLHPNGGVIVNS